MSASSSPQAGATQPPHRRPKLTVNANSSPHAASRDGDLTIKEETNSPTRPSYSPVTPTLSQAAIAGHNDTQWITEPQPLPVSLEENPDAIALKATLSILQMQRQQSLDDIRMLEKIKRQAVTEPGEFVNSLATGTSREPPPQNGLYGRQQENSGKPSTSFDKLPTAQNVVRCPPIEWAKYNVVGEALETLHEAQQKFPGVTDESLVRGTQPQPHVIAAPYRPFIDKIKQQKGSSDAPPYDK